MTSAPDSGREAAPAADAIERLAAFIDRHRRPFVLTGAGVSTGSGIPDYRDERGEWKHRRPVLYQDFVTSPEVRRRYWARSYAGWPRFGEAAPNGAHHGLADLERAGRIHHVVTQNVDGLHQRAGSRRVIDLHGRLDTVDCLDCGSRLPRRELQVQLAALNPGWRAPGNDGRADRPDGDREIGSAAIGDFRPADCPDCGGVLKPSVVFFGESVPGERVRAAMARLDEADALLVVGSSLMVFSGFRFARRAAELGLPIAAVNRGRTRADALLALKLEADCGDTVAGAATRLLA
jgi:NAD-dependent SIR2 family protein deacetylase